MTHSVENPDIEEPRHDEPEEFVRRMAMRFQQVSGPPWLAISDKVTSEHITEILGQSGRSQEINLRKSIGARWERFAYVALGTIFLVFLTIFVLPKHPDMYAQILEWAGLFLAGGLGGYGIGIRRSSRANASDD